MLKIVLLAVSAYMAIAHEVCEVREGNKLETYGGTKETMKLPCKYNAIRRTVCGNSKITISPGNIIDPDRHKYIIDTLWIGIETLNNGLKWEGRTELNMIRQSKRRKKDFNYGWTWPAILWFTGEYQAEKRNSFVVKKDGYLETEEVFDFEISSNRVTFKDKAEDFKIHFGLFDAEGPRHRSSGFELECDADTFKPSDYPVQICGNGTQREVKLYKKSIGYTKNRNVVMLTNIFKMAGLEQTDSNCDSAGKALRNRCKTDATRLEAMSKCWKIFGRKSMYSVIEDPASAFNHCLQFTCSDFTDPNACHALGVELADAPALPGVSNKIDEVCSHLFADPETGLTNM